MWDVRVVPAVKVVLVQTVEVLAAKVALVQTVEARKASVRDDQQLSKHVLLFCERYESTCRKRSTFGVALEARRFPSPGFSSVT